MTDDEAKELTERAFAAMGWRRMTIPDWDGRDTGSPDTAGSPDVSGWIEPGMHGAFWRVLPDIRTSACLPHLLDWLDGRGLYWGAEMDRGRRSAVRLSHTCSWDEPYLSWDLVPPMTFHDTLGEAMARAIIALCAAKDGDNKGATDD